MVKINGEFVSADEMTVSEYLAYAGYDRARIAVERNGEIIIKSEYDTAVFVDGDCVEIVHFVGGG